VQIIELAPQEAVERELMLLTVKADPVVRGQIIELVQVFEGRIVGVGQDELMLMLAGSPAKLDDLEELVRPYGIVELQRTGRVALPKLERRAPRLRSVSGKVS
jgi:acetolactate synthase-1/3 small subunit